MKNIRLPLYVADARQKRDKVKRQARCLNKSLFRNLVKGQNLETFSHVVPTANI